MVSIFNRKIGTRNRPVNNPHFGTPGFKFNQFLRNWFARELNDHDPQGVGVPFSLSDVGRLATHLQRDMQKLDPMHNPTLLKAEDYLAQAIRRCYIAGPMSSQKNFNYPTFDAAERLLYGRGIEVENPAQPRIGSEDAQPYGLYMRRGLIRLVSCDSICLLPRWYESDGACMEALAALFMGMKFLLYTGESMGIQYTNSLAIYETLQDIDFINRLRRNVALDSATDQP